MNCSSNCSSFFFFHFPLPIPGTQPRGVSYLYRCTMTLLGPVAVKNSLAWTVMLVYNAPHPRVVEEVFEPEHYLYWSNASDFEAKLRDVLANYERYVPMALR
eukprot:EG_transcript_51814